MEYTGIKELKKAYDYCTGKYYVNDRMLYSHFENNGTVSPLEEEKGSLCYRCLKSNSFGKHGCPRKNKGQQVV